jgi:hypothetical protein
MTEPAPRVRAPRAESGKVVTPPVNIDPETGELF